MWEKNMHSTSSKHSKKTTQSQKNGTAKYPSALHQTGIKIEEKCIYHYQATSRSISSSSTTNNRKIKINPTQASLSSMGTKINMPCNHNQHHVFDKKGVKLSPQVCGNVLFLVRAVDSTLMCPISAIASQSANQTKEIIKQRQQMLDYIVTQEEAIRTYSQSDMKLEVHSNASYLSRPNARSRAGGHFFLSKKNNDTTEQRHNS